MTTSIFTRRHLLAGMAALAVAPALGAAAQPSPAPLPEWPIARLRTLARRLDAIQAVIGHGRFNLVSWDDVRAAASRTAQGVLRADEEASCEELFALDARRIGFYGERVVRSISYALPVGKLVDVGGGQHVFPEANALFLRAKAAVGPPLIVTSGARGIPKQMLVFLHSALRAGIVARAVHSVAPAGYSYHAVGDIDVGDRTLGGVNFTTAFAGSDTYRRLAALPYVHFRYPRGNRLGVQWEPWHLKVAA